MNNFTLRQLFAIALMSSMLIGCSDEEEPFLSGGNSTPNAGTVSQKNFSILVSEVDPEIIDSDGVFSKTDIEVTAYIGDRNNQQLTDSHTIYFATEYGLIEPSCTTVGGSCSVTWSAIKRPDVGGPGSDGFTTIVAWTAGEESFTDNNGNGIFDDGDSGVFDDQEEPFINFGLRSVPGDTIFDGNDVVIDTVNGNDPTGANNVHDIADGFFNGGGCTHSSLCSTVVTAPVIWDDLANGIFVVTYSVAVNVSGLSGSATFQNNGADDLTVTANGTTAFNTGLEDGDAYDVTVTSQPTGQTCTVSSGTGNISSANVAVPVSCANNTITVDRTGGTIGGGETIDFMLNTTVETITFSDSAGDNNGNPTTKSFTNLLDNGATYTVTVDDSGSTLNCTLSNDTGTISGPVTVTANCT